MFNRKYIFIQGSIFHPAMLVSLLEGTPQDVLCKNRPRRLSNLIPLQLGVEKTIGSKRGISGYFMLFHICYFQTQTSKEYVFYLA